MEENCVVTKKYTSKESIVSAGTAIDSIGILKEGRMEASNGNIGIHLGPGSILGIFGFQAGAYVMDYIALEDVTVQWLEGKQLEDLKAFLETEEQYRNFVVDGSSQAFSQLNRGYEMLQVLNRRLLQYIAKHYTRYKELCGSIGCEPQKSLKLENMKIFSWNMGSAEELIQYFREFSSLPEELRKTYFAAGDTLVLRHLKDITGTGRPLIQGCEMQLTALGDTMQLLCGDGLDNVFALYMEILKNSKTPKMVLKELLDDMQGMVDLYEKTEQMVTQKLHMKLGADGAKYRTLFENIAGFYKSSLQSSVQDTISQMEQVDEVDELDDYQNLTDKLLEYSGLEEEVAEAFRSSLQQYQNLPDKTASDDQARRVRKELTELFYSLYEAVFFKAEEEERNSRDIRLLLDFGITDEHMFEKEELDTMTDFTIEEELPIPVHTMRQWLHKIYIGEREPSRNEFDQDYTDYVRTLNKGKEIGREEMERLQQPDQKVRFEIKNFFRMNNRLTSGHLLSFCPVVSREELGEDIAKQMVDARQVNEAVDRIRRIDFSIFYRDVMYEDPKNGINSLIIHKEVLPEVILMPNAGSMGRMWQEISGKKRATPGRFTLPLFLKNDLDQLMIKVIGSFRWEICKRVQGSHWNDPTEPSLTAEYCDYLQFYKKNRELSDKAKEKLSQMMVKYRNNYGDVFTEHYKMWILSESAGNVRLDKVSRNILGRYCPFSNKMRGALLEHPIFGEPLGRYERERRKKLKELNNRRAAIRNCNGTETEDFLQELQYYEM